MPSPNLEALILFCNLLNSSIADALGHFSMSRNQAKAVGLLHWLKLMNTHKRKML